MDLEWTKAVSWSWRRHTLKGDAVTVCWKAQIQIYEGNDQYSILSLNPNTPISAKRAVGPWITAQNPVLTRLVNEPSLSPNPQCSNYCNNITNQGHYGSQVRIYPRVPQSKGFSKLSDSMENWNEIDEEKSLTTWRIEAEWMELRLEISDEKGWEERCVG